MQLIKYQYFMIKKGIFTTTILLCVLSKTFVNAQKATDTLFNHTKVYELGEVVISENIDKDFVTQTEINKLNKHNVADAIQVLPSISLCNVDERNESTVYLRGFDIRSVPVFVDGIPVYMPFDGYVDLARFTTSGLSKIEVSKGYSSILYGANTMGGTINLISRKPQKKLEISEKAGIISGKGYKTEYNVGSNLGKLYLSAHFSLFKKSFYPLSNDFVATERQEKGKRLNAHRKDKKASLKIGFTPNKTDEYSLNYIYQHGEKGNPVYTGDDPNIRTRYWQWPIWDKQSIYFISKTQLGNTSKLKVRLYFDTFKNQLNSYDDASYTTQESRYAFTSYYNDYTYGANIEASTEKFKNNLLRFAFHYKNDTHREHNKGEPQRKMADHTISVGIEDEYAATDNLRFVPGISYNMRNSIMADDYNYKTGKISLFPENDNAAINAQMAIYYRIKEKTNMQLTVARKTRFATMKNRYSYKLGVAAPNPSLKAETAINYEFAVDYNGNKVDFHPAVFYSRLNNTIQMVNEALPGMWQMQNTGEAQFYGFDFAFNFQLSQHILLTTNYTYIERENITNPDLKFTDVPMHQIFGYIDCNPVENLNFVLSTNYNSERFSTTYGTKALAFTVFNLQASYIFARKIKLETGINNIFDKNYELVEGYPEAGRNFYATIAFQFHRYKFTSKRIEN